jgi:signal peptidase I
MLGLLAQYTDSGFAGVIERLARTPIDKVVIFAVVCTLIRVGIWRFLQDKPIHIRKQGGPRFAAFMQEVCDALIYAGIVVFLLIRPFVIQTFKIPSESMVPTLLVGDLLIVNKAVYRYSDPQAGDIVVISPEPAAAPQPATSMAAPSSRAVAVRDRFTSFTPSVVPLPVRVRASR